MKPTHFIFDVDGVFTTGQFLYTAKGKLAKIFGAHDADGVKLIRPYFEIAAITADKRGYAITKKRIEDDMGLPLELVPEQNRLVYISRMFKLEACIYMGDGMFDMPVMRRAAYSIAPGSAFAVTKEAADFVTTARGGEGAVGEACWHVLEKFVGPVELEKLAYDIDTRAWK